MTNFLDEYFIKQEESRDSMPIFIAYLCLCIIESIGLLLLLLLSFGLIFQLVMEPVLPPFLSKIIGITGFISILLYGILVPIHTLFKRGNFMVFKDSLLRMNLIGIGLWTSPCFLLGLGLYDVSIGLCFLAWLSIGIFLTSLLFKYSPQRILSYAFAFYGSLSILLFLWRNS